jgi:RNA polymerase sigma factor (sigma-70 family)
MSSLPGTVSHWVAQLKAGDAEAAQRLWNSYFGRLVALARQMLRGAPRAAADEEDVVLSAFDSFCRGVEQGRFPRLDDRDDLWQLLFVITRRKAIDLVQHERRQKRRPKPGDGAVRHASALESDSSAPGGLNQVADSEPTPEMAAEGAEECRRLLDLLGDATLQSIAVAKMEGYTSEEIAAQLGCSLPTVERKLRRIRLTWQREITP